jgi:hypothetical protein
MRVGEDSSLIPAHHFDQHYKDDPQGAQFVPLVYANWGASICADSVSSEREQLRRQAARATPADHNVRDATLFDILMRRNIELTDEAYLSMRVVGVPPSEDEFVAALKEAIDAAIESQRSGDGS